MAAIAAEFEDCMQTYHSLCAAMDANLASWPQMTPVVHANRVRFLQWGAESGAATRALDYALHKSSELRIRVVDLLENLNSLVQSARELVQTAAVPLLSPAILSASQVSYFDRRPDDRLDAITSPVVEADLQAILDDIDHISGLLDRLSPLLRNPPPLDLFLVEEDGQAIEAEVEVVRGIFPKASATLIRRLSKANWRRRLFLRSVRSRMRHERSSTNQTASTPGSTRQSGLQSPPAMSHVPPSRLQNLPRHHRSILGRLNSRRTSVSDSTAQDSGFWSKADSRFADTATSTTGSETQGSAKLDVPPPPVALENGTPFRCPHCGLDMVVGETDSDLIKRWDDQSRPVPAEGYEPSVPLQDSAFSTATEVNSTADWRAHVLQDIEPYICTWDPCDKASDTFGNVTEWLRHELDAHRLPRLWHCQVCGDPSEDLEAFLGHLNNIHGVPHEQASDIASFCERFTGDSPRLDCSLCGLGCTTIDSFRTHVGGHLEQLALISFDSDEKVEEELPISPMYHAASADVESFISSQSKFYSNVVFQPQMTLSSTRGLTERPDPRYARKAIQDSATTAGAKRPSMRGRGPSYSYMTDARKQALNDDGIGQETDKKPLGGSSDQPKPHRTHAPPKNVDFIGRIDEMNQIHTELSQPGKICVLSGVGGLGKSALAVEYTYRFESAYSYIFWVQAETPMVCADAFSQIAVSAWAQQGDPLPSTDEQRLISLSQEFLEETTGRWLLVFDNVDEKLDLRRFLPLSMASTNGSVLITTNRPSIALDETQFDFAQLNLTTLTLEESRRLLLSATAIGHQVDAKTHPEYQLAGDIAKRAERLPLALSLIAGYVIESRSTLADFVDLWNQRRKNIRSSSQSSKDTFTATDDTMESLWDIGLREVTSDARKLLNILAFLDPDHVQKDLLVGAHEDPVLELLHSSEAARFRRMINELKRRRLIAVETRDGEDTLSIHRKLQARILRELDKDSSLSDIVFRQAFTLLRSRFPTASPIQVPEPEKWPVCRKYLPHLLSFQRLMLGNLVHLPPTVQLATLFSDGGIDLWERGMTTEGLELLRSAEAILDRIGAAGNELLRANIHVIISLLLQDSGLVNIGECHDRIKAALEIRRGHWERSDPGAYLRNNEVLLYNAWSDYGCVLLQLNMIDEAEPIFEMCLEQYLKWGDTAAIPYEYAKGHHHMAFCLMYRASADEAVLRAVAGLDNVQSATGTSAAYARWKFDLACLILQHPDFLTSAAMQTQVVNMQKEVLDLRLLLHGKAAFLTLESYYAIGAVLSLLGNIAEAETYMRTILETEKDRPGSCNELALARTQFHLSQLLLALEEGSQASQHPTSRSETETTTSDLAASMNPSPEPSSSTLKVPRTGPPRLPSPSIRPTLTLAAARGKLSASTQAQMTSPPSVDDPVTNIPSLLLLAADGRAQETETLARSATKIINKHRAEGSGPMWQIAMAMHHSERVKHFVEENPIVVYDLMQPVFDGRFAGRDAMEYLRLVRTEAQEGRGQETGTPLALVDQVLVPTSAGS